MAFILTIQLWSIDPVYSASTPTMIHVTAVISYTLLTYCLLSFCLNLKLERKRILKDIMIVLVKQCLLMPPQTAACLGLVIKVLLSGVAASQDRC